MAGRSAVLAVKIVTDASGATKGLDAAAGKVGRLESAASRLAKPAAVAFGALALGAKKAIDSASDLQQAVGGVEAVFGKSADKVLAFGRNAAESVGLSNAEFNTFATQVGASLRNAGIPMSELGDKTNDLITRGADLSSMFGGTTADAVQAMGAALRGEYDPLEKYGTSLTEAAVNAKLAADGNDDLKGTALAQAKVQARLALLMDQTALAQGNFAKEADTAAGQQQRATAKYEDAKAALGKGLLPAYTQLMQVLGQVASWIGQNVGLASALAGTLAGLSAAVLAVNAAFKAWGAISTAITAVKTAMEALKTSTLATRVGLAALAVQEKAVAVGAKIAGAATVVWSGIQKAATVVSTAFGVAARAAWAALTGPIGLVVLAITAVVAIVVALWNKNKGFRDFVLRMWAAIKTAALAVWNGIKAVAMAVFVALRTYVKVYVTFWKAAFKGAKTVVTAVWNAIKAAGQAVFKALRSAASSFSNFIKSTWNGIKRITSTVWGWIKTYVSLQVKGMTIVIRALRTAAVAVWNAIKAAASRVWSAIRGVVSRAVAAMKATFNGLKTAASAVWRAISSAARGPLNAIKTIIGGIRTAFDAVARAVSNVVGWIGRIRFPEPPAWMKKVGGAIGSVFSGRAASAPSGGGLASNRAAAPTAGAWSSGGTSHSVRAGNMGGTTTIINVQGGLDSADTIARRIEALLAARQRRTGRPVMRRA